jgi:hypothetical protein
MGQSFEKLGLELADFTHGLIFIYYHICDSLESKPYTAMFWLQRKNSTAERKHRKEIWSKTEESGEGR